MGCVSSKSVQAGAVAADVYRPPATSIALFDINTVEEPWLITAKTVDGHGDIDEEKLEPPEKKAPTAVPFHLLEKLESYELAPKSWSEVSKALEDLKPTLDALQKQPLTPAKPTLSPADLKKQATPPPPPGKTDSFQAVDGQEKKLPDISGFRSLKENSFILRDREERERQRADGDGAAKPVPSWRRDPLEGYPEKCPPGNPNGVVLYTTTLRGVRRTFEDCEEARRVLEGHAIDVGVQFEERDVSLHGEFLKEVRELAGEDAAVPRLFVRGRYVGGVEQVVELSETGRLRHMLRWLARSGETGGKGGRLECEGCGGARFVPCLECNGSCKVVAEDGKGVERCPKCNENGLDLCPLCH